MRSFNSQTNRIILFGSLLVATVLFLYVYITTQGTIFQVIKLTQVYAFCALISLFLTLLSSPFCRTFPTFPLNNIYIRARKSLGLVSFFFALLHASFAFFGELGGFNGLFFLDNTYLLSITLSFIALLILLLLAISFFDSFLNRYKIFSSRKLEVGGYIAGILILIHSLELGTQFQSLNAQIPELTFSGVAILLVLLSYQADVYLKKRYISYPQVGVLVIIVVSMLASSILFSSFPQVSLPSINVHAAHIQLAKDALQASQTTSTIPGLDGDKTLRYSVSFNNPQNVLPNQDTALSFTINHGESGNPVYYFKTPYQYPMHVVIVDSTLTYFDHIHPVQTDNTFSVTTQFPHEGYYHIYIDFQAFGGIEQEFGYLFKVGNPPNQAPAAQKPDTDLTKTFGNNIVTLSYTKPLLASQMTIGQQKLMFTILDAQTHKPITNLMPYLNAFGHLVMIKEDTYDYVHVHPTNLKAPPPTATSGPTVDFLPIGIYGPFKPGIYRVFGQFNPGGNLFTVNFTIQIQ